MSTTPERVWLQLYGDMDVDEVKNEPSDIVADVLASGDVSWCAEQIFSADIEYIRIDLYEQLQADVESYKTKDAEYQQLKAAVEEMIGDKIEYTK